MTNTLTLTKEQIDAFFDGCRTSPEATAIRDIALEALEMRPRPIRIQRKRTKGWKMPANTVCVDRSTKWGNPFRVHHPGTVFELAMTPVMAVNAFRSMLEKEGAWTPVPLPWPRGKIPKQWTTIEDVRRELHGKNLACFCPLDQPCHADVLLELANTPNE